MSSAHRLAWVALALQLVAATAFAQGVPPPQPQTTPPPQTRTVPPGNMWSHGTTLNGFGGTGVTSGDWAAIGGGAIGWEIKPWFALEGSAMWVNWGHGTHAFTPSLTAQASLLTPRPVVPFLTGGLGLYRASFDRVDSTMPAFYRRRMSGMSELRMTMAFTDPSLVGGGGLNVFLSRHWTLRPEVLATMVMRNSNTFVVTTGAVRLAYHFEEHPIAS